MSRERPASSSVHSPNGILWRRFLEPLLSDRLAFLLTAALCVSTFGATPAMAGDAAGCRSARLLVAARTRSCLTSRRSLPSLTQPAPCHSRQPRSSRRPSRATRAGARSSGTTGSDFVAFPKRKSTWAILAHRRGGGVGGASVGRRDQRERRRGGRTPEVPEAGQVPRLRLGAGRRGGRALPGRPLCDEAGRPRHPHEQDVAPGVRPAAGQPGHPGVHLRHQVRGASGTGRPASAAPSRPGTRRSPSPRPRCWSATSATAPAGRCSSSPATCRPAASPTTAIS